MPTFAWIARDSSGRTQRGTAAAASEAALLQRLRGDGLTTLDVRRASAQRSGGRRWWHRVLRPRSEDVELGLEQIAFMLRSGLPLTSALETAARQSQRGSMAWTWRQVSERVQSGGSFSQALQEHRCFPKIVTTMAALGEATGVLDDVLRRSAEAMERRRELRTNILTAMAYPAVVIVMAVGVAAFMVVSLVPKLTKFLSGFHRRLPPVTQLLIDISAWINAHIAGLALAGIAAGVAFILLRRWPRGRLATDRAALRLPVVSRIVKLAETSTFSRSLGLLLASGVRVTDALSVVEPLLANEQSRLTTREARERILSGSGIAEPLADAPSFYPMLSSMVAVGESAGTVEEVLAEVAEYHESRLQVLIKRLGSIIEPVVIVVIGGIVGFVYMAFFLAVYSIVGGK
ncbi:MAG: type II secretion system F family protein [Planctomycetia bacterium]|nr:type II secretion system F family protein [Planctomycetia bacterium]